MIRVYLSCLIAILIVHPAQASPIPCWKVKAAIAWAGNATAAEALARKYGYTAAEIAEARKCLKL